MTRREYWIGIGVLVIAILLHAAWPRYEWRNPGGPDPTVMVRIDRWHGSAQAGRFVRGGAWQPFTVPSSTIDDTLRQLDETVKH